MIGHLGFGQILDDKGLLGADSRKCRGKEYLAFVFQVKFRCSADTIQGQLSGGFRQVIQSN